ncbi:SH3 domain-containing protein [Bacillus atrophaeus]|uniref:SH3 domain-containing protein n=1 Tax=Bacillus atrophaeus TaxID=1452 RepID=UPI001EFB372F|nr:SH3 domain-containing protein [Bacillus atrophaeus]MCG8398764.1 SH3 domain-containing protein [Bacillus atrophaeus]
MKMKKALIAFTAAAGLGFTAAGNVPFDAVPTAQASSSHQTNVTMPTDSYMIKAGELNVRTQPNHKGKILGTLKSEDKVNVKGFAGADWAEIQFKGQKAYISTHFLMKQTSLAKTANKTTFYSPTPEVGKKQSISSGTKVSFLGWGFSENGGFDFNWAYVDYDGVRGYIHTDDLQLNIK